MEITRVIDLATDELIADSVERLFAEVDASSRLSVEHGKFDTLLWRRVVDSGFHLVMATEEAGGFGLGWRSAYPLFRAIGYWQVPLPLAETIVAAMLGSLAGFGLPDGPMTMFDLGSGNGVRVSGDDNAPILNGEVHHVPWARDAHAAVVGLADGRLARLDLVGEPGLTIRHNTNHAQLPSDSLFLEDVCLQTVLPCPFLLPRSVLIFGAIARSVMLVGALESALEQAVRYAGDRVQFGKPIGKFQVIQQNLALMASDLAAARVAAMVAINDAPHSGSIDAATTWFSAAVAKVRAGEGATRGAAIAHQVHGAIGFTQEYALQFATRRLWAWREEFGTEGYWGAELGRRAIDGGGDDFWRSVTRKSFDGDLVAPASMHATVAMSVKTAGEGR